jgi:hypothetical protein
VSPRTARVLTPDEAETAIYVDYEGTAKRPPTLLGWLIDDDVRQVIVEDAFGGAAARRGARHVTVVDHAALVEAIVAKAEREGRVLVSWSNHDCNLMRQAAPHLQDRIDALHHNAIATARRWARLVRRRRVAAPHELTKYLDRVGYRVPERFGPGLVGANLRALRGRLAEGRSWADLTAVSRRKWRDVVGHNRHDLLGMRKVVVVAAMGLANSACRRRGSV